MRPRDHSDTSHRRRAARAVAAVLVALVVAAVPPAAAVTDGPASFESRPVADGATADRLVDSDLVESAAGLGTTGPAALGEKNATENHTSSEFRTRERSFPAPGRETLRERREAAFDVVYENGTVSELARGSLVVHPSYRYAPETDHVTMRTWHHQRVRGDWESGLEIVYDGGYVAEMTVDPDAEAVTSLRLSRRPREVVTKTYTDAEQAAVRVAVANATVAGLLDGTDHYVSMVRTGFDWADSSCTYGTCYVVTIDRVNHPGQLAVRVSPAGGRVLGVTTTAWTATPATDPDVSPSDYGTASVADPAGELQHNPVSKHNWYVEFTSTSDNGTRIEFVEHNGTMVLWQAQITQIDVYYPNLSSPLHDDLGNPSSGPTVNNYTDSFSITATYYLGCTASTYSADSDCYKYKQIWRFHENGDFDPWLEIYGPGLADDYGDPVYDTHWRFDTDVDGFDNDTIRFYSSLGWSPLDSEDNLSAGSPTDSNGNKWSVRDATTGLTAYVAPYAPDDADAYALRYEFVSDTQPEKLVDGEAIFETDVMFYYVSHTDYGNQSCSPTYPCIPGSTWELF